MNHIEREIEKRIVRDPEILRGKPVVRGTRIPVYVIVESFGNGSTESEILEDFPDLTVEDVRAALAYYVRVMAAPISA